MIMIFTAGCVSEQDKTNHVNNLISNSIRHYEPVLKYVKLNTIIAWTFPFPPCQPLHILGPWILSNKLPNFE